MSGVNWENIDPRGIQIANADITTWTNQVLVGIRPMENMRTDLTHLKSTKGWSDEDIQYVMDYSNGYKVVVT